VNGDIQTGLLLKIGHNFVGKQEDRRREWRLGRFMAARITGLLKNNRITVRTVTETDTSIALNKQKSVAGELRRVSHLNLKTLRGKNQ